MSIFVYSSCFVNAHGKCFTDIFLFLEELRPMYLTQCNLAACHVFCSSWRMSFLTTDSIVLKIWLIFCLFSHANYRDVMWCQVLCVSKQQSCVDSRKVMIGVYLHSLVQSESYVAVQ